MKYENERLLKTKNNKKVFADSAVLTTAMLKKCVRVPFRYVINTNDPDNLYHRMPDSITQEEFEKIK
jgi:hypothetical protein